MDQSCLDNYASKKDITRIGHKEMRAIERICDKAFGCGVNCPLYKTGGN